MSNLLKNFLEEISISDYINESFDYNFDYNWSIEKFSQEYKKFMGLYNSLFYHNNRLVTVFNSYEIRLKKEDLRQIFKLYLYAKQNNIDSEKIIIMEFLYTYFNTINSLEYKNNYEKSSESKKDFKNILEEYNITKKFFNEYVDELYGFYKKLLLYGIDNDIFISGEIVSRIFNNLNQNEEYYNELINLLVRNKVSLCNVIRFDNYKSKNIDAYLFYIMDSLDTFGGYNYAKEMIFELDKGKCLNDEMLNNIINKYINIVNNLCRKLSDKKYSFIQGLSEIDNLKKELNYILQKIESLNESHKLKIRQCLSYLLRLKRYLISDDSYVLSEMHESVYQQEIPKTKIIEFKKSLLKNVFSLYSASKVKFSKNVGDALESYAKYPLQSVVSMFHIDSSNQIYLKDLEEKRSKSDNFKTYYDSIGREYTLSHPKLMNKLSHNYYEELLRYLSKTFLSQQTMTLSVLGKDDFNKILKKLKQKISYDINNDYAIVVSNILAIEADIIKLLKKNKLKISSSGFENLNTLFDFYENEEKKDGLMYLNYTLYEKSGLNLRNCMMHGTMINKDLNVSLLVTFSGLIFVSWLLNEK